MRHRSKAIIHLFWLGSPLPNQYKLGIINCQKLNSHHYDTCLWYDPKYFSIDHKSHLTTEIKEIKALREYCQKNHIALRDITEHKFYFDDVNANDYLKKNIQRIVRRVDLLRWDNIILDHGIYIDCDVACQLKKPFPHLNEIRTRMHKTNIPCYLNVEYHHPVRDNQHSHRSVQKELNDGSKVNIINIPGLSNSLIIMSQKDTGFIDYLKDCFKKQSALITGIPLNERSCVESTTGPSYIITALYYYTFRFCQRYNPTPLNYAEINYVLEQLFLNTPLILNITKMAEFVLDTDILELMRNKPSRHAPIITDYSWTDKGRVKLDHRSWALETSAQRIQNAYRLFKRNEKKRNMNNSLKLRCTKYTTDPLKNNNISTQTPL